MDNLLYFILTDIVCLVSLIGFIILLTVHIAKKIKFGLKSYVLLILFIFGMYLFIPSRYMSLGFAYQNPELINKALKLSVNPYEKRLCYKYLSDIYTSDIFNQGIKDGNKAIEYLEKAINGEYKKYSGETLILAYGYSIKGDYNKTIELNNLLDNKKGASLLHVYLMQGDYRNALNATTSDCSFLIADLYKKLGNDKKSEICREKAQEIYDSKLKSFKTESERQKYIEYENNFKSVEAYRSWLNTQKKEYKFN